MNYGGNTYGGNSFGGGGGQTGASASAAVPNLIIRFNKVTYLIKSKVKIISPKSKP